MALQSFITIKVLRILSGDVVFDMSMLAEAAESILLITGRCCCDDPPVKVDVLECMSYCSDFAVQKTGQMVCLWATDWSPQFRAAALLDSSGSSSASERAQHLTQLFCYSIAHDADV